MVELIYWPIIEARAEQIAREAHLNQTERSTNDPYILHVQRVVIIANRLLSTPLVRTVAWLHDVVEDSPITIDDLRATFPLAVCDAVWLLTRHKRPDADDYPEYIDRLDQSGDIAAIAVKLADLEDHLRPNCPERLKIRYDRAMVVLGHWAKALDLESW